LRALLGTLPVVRLGDGAVLVVGVSGSVLLPVSSPEGGGVVVVFSSGGNDGVTEANSWGDTFKLDVLLGVVVVLSFNKSEESGNCKEFHYYY
jgi:hypothetical protein